MNKRIILAKFKSACHETGATIRKGDRVLYDPVIKKVYAEHSAEYKAHEQQEREDPAAGAIQANEDAYFDNWCQRNGI